MKEVKHNIDSPALMNASINFDELFIHVLNGLGLACDAPNLALDVKLGCLFLFIFYFLFILVYYKLVHSYTVKHLT